MAATVFRHRPLRMLLCETFNSWCDSFDEHSSLPTMLRKFRPGNEYQAESTELDLKRTYMYVNKSDDAFFYIDFVI